LPLTFRSASAADARAIVAIAERPHARGNLHIPTVAAVASDLGKPGTHVFVVERDRDVVGFVRLVHTDGWLVEIAPLAAREPGTGIGWFAVREALRFAFDTVHAHRTSLEVVATNARARRLYEGFGFELEGTWRDGYRGEDGAFADLCAYGLLEDDYRAAVASRESTRGR
jgi:RimJ/RimL family protein N-acetyltransferase